MSEIITLDMNTPSVQYLCKKDKRLAKVISMVGPITYEPHDEDPYSHMIHEIIEQIMSIKAGQAIYRRLETLCDGSITPDIISRLSDEAIRNCGTSNAKVSFIRELTTAVVNKTLVFADLTDMTDAEVMSKLTSIRGIGSWTAKMYLIFILNRQDVLPFEDGAFLQAYRWLYKIDDTKPSSIKNKCQKWRPYSSIAARFLYKALDSGYTKSEFHLYKE